MSESALIATDVDAKNQVLTASNGVEYAYRTTGGTSNATPLVTLQHFRGNLDNWDPALIGALARGRRVITFDNRGLAASSAQEIALIRPSIVRRLVLAYAAPKGAAGMHGWAADVIAAVGKPETSPEGYLSV